jgi:hypothetical protein
VKHEMRISGVIGVAGDHRNQFQNVWFPGPPHGHCGPCRDAENFWDQSSRLQLCLSSRSNRCKRAPAFRHNFDSFHCTKTNVTYLVHREFMCRPKRLCVVDSASRETNLSTSVRYDPGGVSQSKKQLPYSSMAPPLLSVNLIITPEAYHRSWINLSFSGFNAT